MAGFLGMRSNDDWETDQRPKSWRQMILKLYPNGKAPLTAIQSMGPSEGVNDPEYNWWLKSFESQAGTITGVYTDVLLSAAYSTGGVKGDTVYVKMAEADAKHFSAGKTAIVRDASHPDMNVFGKVTAVSKNGANSYVAFLLKEADDNGATTDLSDADRIKIVGNANPEGGVTPDSISYTPTKYSNYTQIFRTSVEMTRTALRTRLRTGDQMAQAKSEALELHGVEMDWSALFGIPTEDIGDNGKPERTTGGLWDYLRTNNSSQIVNYATDANYSGQTWLEGGEQWLLDILERLFRFTDGSSGDMVALCGNGVIKALERLGKAGLDITVKPGASVGYGIKMVEWITSFGSIMLKSHPAYSYETTMLNTAVIYRPSSIRFRFIDDTDFYGTPDNKNYAYTSSGRRIDGINNEWITEMGWEFGHPENYLIANGWDSTNTA